MISSGFLATKNLPPILKAGSRTGWPPGATTATLGGEVKPDRKDWKPENQLLSKFSLYISLKHEFKHEFHHKAEKKCLDRLLDSLTSADLQLARHGTTPQSPIRELDFAQALAAGPGALGALGALADGSASRRGTRSTWMDPGSI